MRADIKRKKEAEKAAEDFKVMSGEVPAPPGMPVRCITCGIGKDPIEYMTADGRTGSCYGCRRHGPPAMRPKGPAVTGLPGIRMTLPPGRGEW
jgi:hypothetical protein